MKPLVFIETTIPSFYFETRSAPAFATWAFHTRRWWDLDRHKYRLATSPAVLAEIDETPGQKRDAMLALMADVELLPTHPRYSEVVHSYLANKVMPRSAEGDAAHLAAASLSACEYLLTWNCAHLANPRKMRHIQTINSRLSLTTPILCTPHTIGAR